VQIMAGFVELAYPEWKARYTGSIAGITAIK
jgi:hypothetical protein